MAKGSLTLRTTKGSALTYGELDENFVYLNGLITDLNNALYRSTLTIGDCDTFPAQNLFKADVKPGYAWRSKYACTSSYPWWTGSNGVGILASETYNTLNATSLGSLAHGWNNSATDLYSHAEGEHTLSSGKGSHSEGYYTTASGKYSHAEGTNSITGMLGYPGTVNVIQVGSYLPGTIITLPGIDFTSVLQPGTYIFYLEPINNNTYSIQPILGSNNNGSITNPVTYITASISIGISFSQYSIVVASLSSPRAGTILIGGANSHVEGSYSNAAGNSSHAEGGNTLSAGFNSHAEGAATQAIGYASHAEGFWTQAIGERSHAEGEFSIAKGQSSHAEGYTTQASREHSHAEGEFTTIGYSVYSATIEYANRFHTRDTIKLDASYGDLTNIFTPGSYLIYTYGTTVNDAPNPTIIQGVNYTSGFTYVTASINSTNIGYPIFIANTDNLSSGDIEMGGRGAHSEGISTRAAGLDSHAEGSSTIALGLYSHAEGTSTKALDFSSHAEGLESIAYGLYTHAEGHSTLAQGYASHTEGVSTITGPGASYAHAEGDQSQALGYGSHAEGYTTIALGQYSHTAGNQTIASGSYQTVIGKFNKQNNTSDLFIVGSGTTNNTRFDAFTVSNTKIDANLIFNVMTASVAPVTGRRKGSIYFNIITDQFFGWNGTAWVVLG